MNKLYLECTSGISGDMVVAALLDLGVDQDMLLEALDSIPVEGFEIQISRTEKSGMDVCDFHVMLDAAYENHDHDMEYLHSNHNHHKEHHHEQENAHYPEHGNRRHHGHKGAHHHTQRGLREVSEIIVQSKITETAKELALKIFEILGRGEAKAHGTTLEELHFHDAGAVDSIVDIIAAAVCIDSLEIDDVIITELYDGQGTIRCRHGILPIPVPAVSNIAEENGLKLHVTDCFGELITPTGAAIAAAIRTKEQLPEEFTVKKIGLGGGKRTYDCPGFVRALIIN
ncbi:LarC family nickel insertion protein [Faecalicatena contorta]|uniref:LarC family nickel insertion protein n=1 Tax=Faecalicatena contorta TaxID=39482 RepID=A0A315ZSR8_9FIRM|nr:LarC family nickel insertion protein [Faecalicatena contorta]PWJ48601.1 hypothetical protein A8805_111122 [Faecalicatena contorta]SUQ15337.1 hypothetical protein SAMN05216529_111122 [Faecalicatena contorta]